MKLNKYISLALTAALVVSGTYADDFDFGDDFNFGGMGDTGSSSSVEISGSVEGTARAYITGDEEVSELPMAGDVTAKLDVKYSGTNADAEIKLKLDSKTIKENPEGIIDEAYATAYLENFKLEAGQMKNVWGKGDKLHVIDNFNADDYSDFIFPDYIDRRVATPMLKGSYAFDYSGDVLSNVKIEGVYTPFLPVDRFATSGVWVPGQVQNLTEAVTMTAKIQLGEIIKNLEAARLAFAAVAADPTNPLYAATYANLEAANQAYVLALNNASALESDSSIIYPDTNTLKYGQAGARLTASLGTVDLGLSYYYGHYKQPSVNALKVVPALNNYLVTGKIAEEDKFLAYDQKQTFGIEAATILWHFNVRGEACYNLTDDIDGNDPFVHNNSIQWLGGFDIDLPIWNMNINVQETGTYILGNDKISGSATEMYDVDYNKNGYSNNRIVANITTSFMNDKVLPEVTVMYGIENGDLVVMPKFVVKPVSELSLTASGMYIWCRDDNSEFNSWKNNSFAQLGATLTF